MLALALGLFTGGDMGHREASRGLSRTEARGKKVSRVRRQCLTRAPFPGLPGDRPHPDPMWASGGRVGRTGRLRKISRPRSLGEEQRHHLGGSLEATSPPVRPPRCWSSTKTGASHDFLPRWRAPQAAGEFSGGPCRAPSSACTAVSVDRDPPQPGRQLRSRHVTKLSPHERHRPSRPSRGRSARGRLRRGGHDGQWGLRRARSGPTTGS